MSGHMSTDRTFADGSLMSMFNKNVVASILFSIGLLSIFRILFVGVLPASSWECEEGESAPSMEDKQRQNICQPGPVMLMLIT